MKTVLVTNGNLSSLLALGEFLKLYGDTISAIFITTHLPSQKSNVTGILRMIKQSGMSYTYFKLFTNVVLPKKLAFKGLPVSVAQYMRHLGYNAPIIYVSDVNEKEQVKKLGEFRPARNWRVILIVRV